jgi:co-chaperonin GroES (HSP10)
MIKPLKNYLIVVEEGVQPKNGFVIHKMMDDQLVRAKILCISERLKHEYPELKEETFVLFRPYNCYRVRIDGNPCLLVDVNDIIGIDE